MKYFPFHIGDWVTATRYLSLIEKAIYFDLLTLYYDQEGPIMQMQCKRIANGYALDEQEAMQRVLDEFFELDGDVYRHHRCDEEIAVMAATSDKRSRASKKRWAKVKQKESNSNANAMQVDSNSNANGMLPKTQDPIYIKSSSDINVDVANDELSALKVSGPDPVPGNAQDKHTFSEKNKSSWIAYCNKDRPDVNADELFDKFKAHYAGMNGSGPRLSDKEWFAKWKQWVEREVVVTQARTPAVSVPAFGTIGIGKAENIADQLCFKLKNNKQDIPTALTSPGMTWTGLSDAIANAITEDKDTYESAIAPLIVKYGIS